jgi:hypothetical protein
MKSSRASRIYTIDDETLHTALNHLEVLANLNRLICVDSKNIGRHAFECQHRIRQLGLLLVDIRNRENGGTYQEEDLAGRGG